MGPTLKLDFPKEPLLGFLVFGGVIFLPPKSQVGQSRPHSFQMRIAIETSFTCFEKIPPDTQWDHLPPLKKQFCR